jgi:hypothetical protein
MEEEDEVSPSQEIDFCSLGMFIIGERGFPSCVDFSCCVRLEVEPCQAVNVVSMSSTTASLRKLLFFIITVSGSIYTFAGVG